MSNSASFQVLVHGHTQSRIDNHVAHLLGINATSSVNLTAKSSVANPVISKVNTTGPGWTIQLFNYSYDGVIHAESYVSDI